MNIKQVIMVGVAGVAMGALALDNVEVTDVKARQRYPWNGKVDIDFTLDSKATEPYQMQVEVYDNVGKTNLPVKSVCTENVSFESNPCMVRIDTTRIVWDAAKDLPNGFKCTNVLVTCRDMRTCSRTNIYMIVDLANWTISYCGQVPAGGWGKEHKTTKMVFRRVEPQVFYMGSKLSEDGHLNNEFYHQVTLTKPYYIGIYEVTECQFAMIYGGQSESTKPVEKAWNVIRGEDFTSEEGVTTPVNPRAANNVDPGRYLFITQEKNTTGYFWPMETQVDQHSFLGILRTRTGLNFDLPTEAQWECACRAGANTAINIGSTNLTDACKVKGTEVVNDDYISYVGNYMPNSYGIYDMSGNVTEWCLDIYKDQRVGIEIDPIGETNCTEELLLNYTIANAIVGYLGAFYYTTYDIQYRGIGVTRTVRGIDARSSSRSKATNVNTNSPAFSEGIKLWKTYGGGGWLDLTTAEYNNPVHGIRLVLSEE